MPGATRTCGEAARFDRMLREIDLPFLRKTPLPLPDFDGDKNDRGRVLVVAGGVSIPGGALLAATAALRAGAGKAQIGACRSIASGIGLALPEARVFPLPETAEGEIAGEAAPLIMPQAEASNAVLIGPGMLDEGAAARIAQGLLCCKPGPAFVLDAAALETMKGPAESLAAHAGRIVITPHAGEMANLLGVPRTDIAAAPGSYARDVAASFNCVVVLKGAETFIANPGGDLWVFRGGSIGLATSGSGDTLAGVIAGLLARGTTPESAAQWGVYLHGEAGRKLARRRGPIGYLAHELLSEIPSIMAEAA